MVENLPRSTESLKSTEGGGVQDGGEGGDGYLLPSSTPPCASYSLTSGHNTSPFAKSFTGAEDAFGRMWRFLPPSCILRHQPQLSPMQMCIVARSQQTCQLSVAEVRDDVYGRGVPRCC
jgi:hypothetical protein